MERNRLLDDIFWNTLTGPHAQFASGFGGARRYAKGFSPILAFADPGDPDFASLAPFCEKGEHFYCDSWTGAAPEGWRIDAEATMFRMVWNAALPTADEAPDAVALGPEHADQALALATLTKPGPFGPRTIELGEYFGYFDGDRLIAMAGERMHAPGLREISGVCTHPDYQGRGLARKLMARLVHRQVARGEAPFLHVMRTNEAAHQLYLRMGFEDYLETVVRVVARAD
ncbi:GNAT family N-acetyltransferase [Massilia sp. R2A-15]|uniref:GNAT family N-acetyltransferase n=1 Tax=Massilia sp. R2A-15 TaxID=3064278 RepID=UPI002735F39E|nr:GNAT family N-acetyltransferase [Massilia sp. R2A-15]WLI88512.1 GNAT family N-acetyltransferase [Massilia sp. R2A-15]